jgi:hypothetical protein
VTDKNYTRIVIIADHSGSMGEVADPPHTKAQLTTKGIHHLVTEQKAQPGKLTFSMTEFDTSRDIVEANGDGSRILAWTCHPSGGTALLDAVGFGITETGAELAAMPEDDRPGRVIVVVATDGEENSSHEYSGVEGLARVKSMITEQISKYGWDFVFIGTELDAFQAGHSMGIATASTLPVAAGGTMDAYLVTSEAVASARNLGAAVAYSAAQRQQVEDAGRKAKRK